MLGHEWQTRTEGEGTSLRVPGQLLVGAHLAHDGFRLGVTFDVWHSAYTAGRSQRETRQIGFLLDPARGILDPVRWRRVCDGLDRHDACRLGLWRLLCLFPLELLKGLSFTEDRRNRLYFQSL